jgi:hypothetical protein
MRNIKKFLNNLDQDQKDVLKSSLIVVLFSAGIAPFLNAALLLSIIIFPLQFVITGEVFSNDNFIRRKNLYLDRDSKKTFSKSTAVAITFGGFILAVLSIITAACLEKGSFLAFFVLFVPLLVTRSVVFCLRLPLSVMYCLLLEPKQTEPPYRFSPTSGLNYYKRWNYSQSNRRH